MSQFIMLNNKRKFIIPPPPAKSNPFKAPLPDIFYVDLESENIEKPWLNPNQDITDYFNFGFNEGLWKFYAQEVKKYIEKLQIEDIEQEANFMAIPRPIEVGGFRFFSNKNLENFILQKLLLHNADQYFLMNNLGTDNYYDKLPILIYTSIANSVPSYEYFIERYKEEIDISPLSIEEKALLRRSLSRNREINRPSQQIKGEMLLTKRESF